MVVHFMDNGGALTNHKAPWPGHEGRPSWNDDGLVKGVYVGHLGTGGYGLTQHTREPTQNDYKMPRKWIWNWQTNLFAFNDEMTSKVSFANDLYYKLQQIDPSISNVTYCADSSNPPKKPSISAYDAILIALYNGSKGFQNPTPTSKFTSPWVYCSGTWILVGTYPKKVATYLTNPTN